MWLDFTDKYPLKYRDGDGDENFRIHAAWNHMETGMVMEIPHANRKDLYGDRDGDGDYIT